jgi:hypothetical protein
MKAIIRVIAVLASLEAATSLFAQSAFTGGSSSSSPAVVAPVASPVDVGESNLNDPFSVLANFNMTTGSSGGAGSILVVPAGEMSVENLTAANEDMNVMGRILASTLKQAGVASAGSNMLLGDMGSWYVSPAAAPSQGIYLQGYGVLFTMKVGFPLSPSPDSNEPQEKPAKAGGDTVWNQARQDLYEPPADRTVGTATRQQPKYSAERVESMKTALISALKHAVNIRGLQPSDSVIIMVVGQSSRTRIVGLVTMPGTKDQLATDNLGRTTIYKGGALDNLAEFKPATVLTIRAKMSDVTAFSKGDLSLDQFRQKVQILSNPYLGERSDSGRSGRGPVSTSTAGSRR